MRLRWDGAPTRCSAIKNDISGWTPQLRDRKIEQLASVIAAMNTGQGPDLLGVCEVGNRFVIDRLVEKTNSTLPAPRSYAVVHADTDDARGIDVAFVYDDTLFHVPLPVEESLYFHVVMRRHATREIVQVNFKTTTAAAQTWAVFGTIGPAAAAASSSPKAAASIAGETLGYFDQRVLEVHGAQTPVLAMGTSTTNRSTPLCAARAQHPAASQSHLGTTGATVVEPEWPIAGAPDGITTRVIVEPGH
jgi:hypothetical protein